MKPQEMEREKKAAMFDSLLTEHDKLSREVSMIQSKFDLSREDEKKIEDLKNKMQALQMRAARLGEY
jgi:hypothetical protein